MKKEYYLLDGRPLAGHEIRFDELKRGFFYGDGIFETLRAENHKVLRWEDHWDRLHSGAVVCGLEIRQDGGELKRAIEAVLCENSLDRAYIRINCWRKTTEHFDPSKEKRAVLMVQIKTYSPYPEKFYKEGISCVIGSTYFRNEKSQVSRIKSLNYLENILARREAKNMGYDDAILLNTSGFLSSAPVANLFFLKGGRIFTPSADCGILEGITRKAVLEACRKCGMKTEQGFFVPGDIKTADEVFLTNTLMGVLPVKAVGGIFRGSCFEFSATLRRSLAL